jgi:hypothetical protein
MVELPFLGRSLLRKDDDDVVDRCCCYQWRSWQRTVEVGSCSTLFHPSLLYY